MIPHIILFLSIFAMNDVSALYGGEDTELTDVPYYAMIVTNAIKKDFCGGSIIGKQWIVTAAHCLCPTPKGNHMCLPVHKEYMSVGVGSGIHEVEDFYVHEGYVPYTLANDIGLVKLKSSIEYNDKAKPVELTQGLPGIGEIVKVSGFGWTQFFPPKFPEKLQSFMTPVISREECRAQYPELLPPKVTGHFCAGTKVKVACHYDSGGPLVTRRSGLLVGIVSFSKDACKGAATGFTSVARYRSWIQSHFDFTNNNENDYFKPPPSDINT